MAKAASEIADTSKETNAMDYSEHERTYSGFIWLTKWGIAANVALLIAMGFGFFGGMGLIGGFIIFAILIAASFFLI